MVATKSADLLFVAPGDVGQHDFLLADLLDGRALLDTPDVEVSPPDELTYIGRAVNDAVYDAVVVTRIGNAESRKTISAAAGTALLADFDATAAVAGRNYLVTVTVRRDDGAVLRRYAEVRCVAGQATAGV